MSYFKQPLLLMFLGSPGSGKSYFARHVAEKINAVRINGDSMRLSIFGSAENRDRLYAEGDRDVLNSYVFNALDYAAEQILIRGIDVVYDANHNKRSIRQDLELKVSKCNAVPVVVWIKTPYEVALKRGQTREDQVDQRRFTEDMMKDVMARIAAATDDPDEQELVVTIDGQVPFEGQFASFQEQLEALHV